MNGFSKRLRIKEEDIPDRLYPLLDGRVFHVTPYKRYEQIKQTGFIDANQDGKLGYNFSEKSFGRYNGWVCLFDFRTELKKIAEDSAYRWGFYFHNEDRFGNRLSFLFLDPTCYHKLISWEAANEEREYMQLIPYAECWYPGNVPLDAISDVTHIHIMRKPVTGHAKAVRDAWKLIDKKNKSEKA
jgi:hypothetical protein